MTGGMDTVVANIKAIEANEDATAKDEDLLTTLEVVYEFYLRGFEFAPISVYESHATKFLIKDGKILPPFVAVSGLGESAAWDIMNGSRGKTFLSIEEFSAACPKASKTHIQMLKDAGALDPKVLNVDTNTLLYQVPGGMLSNLIGQLKQANAMDKYYDVLAEVPRVRKDCGLPPLVTPTSQIVGTQAVMNILGGERYKMVPKESKGLLRGEYGQVAGVVNEEVRKKALGDAEIITCRPADLIAPEMDKYREETKGFAKSEEDVLSIAMFPQVATKFITERDNPKPKEDPNAPRELFIEDLGN